jgi:hypothetical protein
MVHLMLKMNRVQLSDAEQGWLPSPPAFIILCCGLNVCVVSPENLPTLPATQSDDIRIWGLWEVTGSWRQIPHECNQCLYKTGLKLGMVVHTCNSSTQKNGEFKASETVSKRRKNRKEKAGCR